MPWYTTPTLTTGQFVTAANWNAIVADLAALVGRRWVYIDGAAVRADLTNGCDYESDQTLTAGRPLLMGSGFSGTADQFAQFKVPLPKMWNAGTITFRVRWASPNAGAGDVVWQLQGSASADGEAIDQAYGTGVKVTDTFQGASKTHRSPESAAVTIGNTPTKEDLIYFRLGRLASSDAADTKVEKVYLEGVELFLTTDAVND